MQRSHVPSSVAQTSEPDIPLILVEDYTVQPITTTKYICHDNELDFEVVYKKIRRLLSHTKCSHRASEDDWPCAPCEKSFSDEFWASAAHLLDYFADFLHIDTPIMQALWFHLLDIWQEAIDYFPCDDILDSVGVSPVEVQAFTKARWLLKTFNDTISLMNTVIHGTEEKDTPREPIIHNPAGDYRTPAGEDYNTGPYVSGAKPWEQWLSKGNSTLKSDDDEEACLIPAGAIAIIKTHTERAERLAVEINPDPEFLAAFKKHSIVFPQKPNTQVQTYTSLAGTTVSYHLENGAPPVMRPSGFADEQLKSTKPNFNLLDEYVGRARAMTAYRPVSGDVDEDGEWEDGFEPFDVWSVTESKGGGEGGEKEDGKKGWEEALDTWIASDAY